MATTLRLVTWNIHKGIGTDRTYALERVIEVLRLLNADIVCLQEVDHRVRRSSFENQKKRLRRELGYPYSAMGLNVKVGRGAYGNVTLSKFPVESRRNLDLTVAPKKRRRALITHVAVRGQQTWVVANVHLGLMHVERKIQVRRLLAHLSAGIDKNIPLVIAGDWNEWGTRLVRGILNQEGLHVARVDRQRHERTWPSRKPLVALDRVVYRAPVRCHHVACILDDATRVASDHVPLVVELTVPGLRAAAKEKAR